MAIADAPIIPIAGDPDSSSAVAGDASPDPQAGASRLWQRGGGLSSVARSLGDRAEGFLAGAGFDRAPWLAVLFASGILTWFALKTPWQWVSAIGAAIFLALLAVALWRDKAERDQLRRAVIACSLIFAAGLAVVWARSEMIGASAIERPVVERV